MGVVALKVETKEGGRESWHGEDEEEVIQKEIERMADRRLTLAIALECRTHAVVRNLGQPVWGLKKKVNLAQKWFV